MRDTVEEITRTSKAQVGVPSDLLSHFAVKNIIEDKLDAEKQCGITSWLQNPAVPPGFCFFMSYCNRSAGSLERTFGPSHGNGCSVTTRSLGES